MKIKLFLILILLILVPVTHFASAQFNCGDGICDPSSSENDATCPIDCTGGSTDTHHICQNNACYTVNGTGSDQCSTDADCISSGGGGGGGGGGTPPTPVAPVGSCNALASNPNLQKLICFVVDNLIGALIPLIFALSVAVFVWGVVQYVIGADEEKERAKGKQFMIWGIVALAVMVSVWGLVKVVTNTFNIQGTFIPQVKQ